MKIKLIFVGFVLICSSGLALAEPASDSSDDQTIAVQGEPSTILPDLYAAIQRPAENSPNQNPNSPTSPNNHPSLQRAQEANQ